MTLNTLAISAIFQDSNFQPISFFFKDLMESLDENKTKQKFTDMIFGAKYVSCSI